MARPACASTHRAVVTWFSDRGAALREGGSARTFTYPLLRRKSMKTNLGLFFLLAFLGLIGCRS